MVILARVLLLLHMMALAALAGGAVTFFGSIFLSKLAGASDVNGGLAMGAASLALVGTAVGAAVGGVFAWIWLGRIGPRANMIGGYGLTALSVTLVAGYFLTGDLRQGSPFDPDAEPTVHVEWRLPEQVNLSAVTLTFRYSMKSSYMNWTLSSSWDDPQARNEDDRTILRFRGNIRWRVRGRTFQLWRAPHHNDRITVDLGLARDPELSEDYSPWQDVPGHPGHAFRTRVSLD